MPRPHRIEYQGAWYHVMNQGARHRPISRSNVHREWFLSLLGEISDTYGVEIHAYCLMGNQYHLLVHTPHGQLSAAMRHLNSVYTQRFNRAVHTDGSLFRGRYKAILVEPDSYLAQVSRYIHLNPVTAKVVKKAEQYRWSSYPAYVGKVKRPEWLHLQPTLSLIGQRHAAKRYKDFVEMGIDDEIKHFYGRHNVSPILSSTKFLKGLKQRRKGNGIPLIAAQILRGNERPRLADILRATAKHFNVDEKTLYQSVRGRGGGNTARLVAMALSRRPGGYPLKEIAILFKVGNVSAISAALKRLHTRMAAEATLARKVAHIQSGLFGR
ncbi:MAG: transposase [Candidatus Binatia bacterium]